MKKSKRDGQNGKPSDKASRQGGAPAGLLARARGFKETAGRLAGPLAGRTDGVPSQAYEPWRTLPCLKALHAASLKSVTRNIVSEGPSADQT